MTANRKPVSPAVREFLAQTEGLDFEAIWISGVEVINFIEEIKPFGWECNTKIPNPPTHKKDWYGFTKTTT